jgi:hypothetical protein
MRYTRAALFTFGAGLLLPLVVVAAEIDKLQRVASTVMALGIAAIPVGMAVDWRLATRTRPRFAKGRGRVRRPQHKPVSRRGAGPRTPPRPSRR